MKLKFKLMRKDCGNVDFSLISDNGGCLGNISIGHKNYSFNFSGSVQIGDKNVKFERIRYWESRLHNPYKHITRRPLFPYRITGFYSEGWMFEQSTLKYGFPRLCLDTGNFVTYTAGFGKEGLTAAFYKDDQKIGTAHRQYKIINDQYDFDMNVDENYLMEATLMVLQWYLNSYYTGNHNVMSIDYTNLTTKDEFLLQKVLQEDPFI